VTTWYRYSYDQRLVAFWGVFGVRPAKDGVTLTDDGRLRATFGLFKLETPPDPHSSRSPSCTTQVA
jgi:hypothetical protein